MAAPSKKSGVYAIRHIESGRAYVGSAVDILARWRAHRHMLTAGKHGNTKLLNAWRKYGSDKFEFQVLELVAARDQLLAREQHWIELLDVVETGFNIAPFAGAPTRGRRLTPEHIAKVIAARSGYSPSAETREKIAAAHRGRVVDRDRVEKQRASLTGRKQPADEIERRRLSMIGHAVSDETRQRIGAAHKGRACPHDRREKIAATLAGHKQPIEQIAKRKATMDARTPEQIAQWKARISAAGKGRKMTPEAIAKRQATRYGDS